MPVIIPEQLPATRQLQEHNIFVMNQKRADTQDIRPLKICILNLMPDKISTETQLLSQLSNNIIQVEITLLTIQNHVSKNTKQSHLDTFYRFFSDVKNERFDGMIITGAPIEHLEFEQVDYWEEIQQILDWSRTHVYCSLFICWANQAALYHFYGIGKTEFRKKLFGVFPHWKERPFDPLFVGMDDIFYVPHSRHTKSDEHAIGQQSDLEILAASKEAGIHLIASKDRRQLYMSGHPEYSTDTLLREYLRDVENPEVEVPANYFVDNDPQKAIRTLWKSSGALFYQNWLNYYVYQETNYDLQQLGSRDWKHF